MYAMSKLQTWGFPIFIGLLVWALISLAGTHEIVGPSGWQATGTGGGAALWTAMSFANGQMIFQGLMATDYGRFARRTIRYRGTSTIMLLELIPMFIIIFLGAMLGASLIDGFGAEKAQDPGFVFVHLMGFAGVVFVIITQIRINVMNLYGGSITLSSGFDVAAHFRPGRPWWILSARSSYGHNVTNSGLRIVLSFSTFDLLLYIISTIGVLKLVAQQSVHESLRG